MNYTGPNNLRMDSEMMHSFILERMDFYYNQHLNLHIRERDNIHFFEYIDRQMYAMVVGLAASIAKGEIVDETKIVTCKFKFNIFTSWFDHLKFRLNKKFGWKLKIGYTKMKKNSRCYMPCQDNKSLSTYQHPVSG